VFSLRHFGRVLLRQFGHLDISVTALVSVLLKAVSSSVVPNLFSVMDPFDDLAESCGPP